MYYTKSASKHHKCLAMFFIVCCFAVSCNYLVDVAICGLRICLPQAKSVIFATLLVVLVSSEHCAHISVYLVVVTNALARERQCVWLPKMTHLGHSFQSCKPFEIG